MYEIIDYFFKDNKKNSISNDVSITESNKRDDMCDRMGVILKEEKEIYNNTIQNQIIITVLFFIVLLWLIYNYMKLNKKE